MEFLKMFSHWKEVEEHDAKTVIFTEGASADALYVITSGEVELSLRGASLGTEGVGGIIGEMALINSNIRSATLTAKTDCRLALIDQASFDSLLRHVPDFSLHVMKVLATRLKHAYEVIGH